MTPYDDKNSWDKQERKGKDKEKTFYTRSPGKTIDREEGASRCGGGGCEASCEKMEWGTEETWGVGQVRESK